MPGAWPPGTGAPELVHAANARDAPLAPPATGAAAACGMLFDASRVRLVRVATESPWGLLRQKSSQQRHVARRTARAARCALRSVAFFGHQPRRKERRGSRWRRWRAAVRPYSCVLALLCIAPASSDPRRARTPRLRESCEHLGRLEPPPREACGLGKNSHVPSFPQPSTGTGGLPHIAAESSDASGAGLPKYDETGGAVASKLASIARVESWRVV